MSLVKWDPFREFTAFNDRLGHFLGRNWDRARLTGDEHDDRNSKADEDAQGLDHCLLRKLVGQRVYKMLVQCILHGVRSGEKVFANRALDDQANHAAKAAQREQATVDHGHDSGGGY